MRTKALEYIKSTTIREIVEWVDWLNTNLEYPNSESSRDELMYTEVFEKKIQEILDRK